MFIYPGPLEAIQEEPIQEDEMVTRSESSLLKRGAGYREDQNGRKRKRGSPRMRGPASGRLASCAEQPVFGEGHAGVKGEMQLPDLVQALSPGGGDDSMSHMRSECPRHGNDNKPQLKVTEGHKQNAHKKREAAARRRDSPEKLDIYKEGRNEVHRGKEHSSRERTRRRGHGRNSPNTRKKGNLIDEQKYNGSPVNRQKRSPQRHTERESANNKSPQIRNKEKSPIKSKEKSPSKGKEKLKRKRGERRCTALLLSDDLFQVDARLLEKLAKCESAASSPDRSSLYSESPGRPTRRKGSAPKLTDETTNIAQIDLSEMQSECKACLKHLNAHFGPGKSVLKAEEKRSNLAALSEDCVEGAVSKNVSPYEGDSGVQGGVHTDVDNNNIETHPSLNTIVRSDDALKDTEAETKSHVEFVRENNYHNVQLNVSGQGKERQDTPRHHSFTRTARSQSGKTAEPRSNMKTT